MHSFGLGDFVGVSENKPNPQTWEENNGITLPGV